MQAAAATIQTENESVVAVLPVQSNSEEVALSQSATAIELEAESIIIESDEQYSAAAEFGKRLKTFQAGVIAFWKPKKDAANKLHKVLCDGEKKMLTPLARAEQILKRTMADSMSRNVAVNVAPPKAQGVSQSKDWEVVSIDGAQVPITFNGMELRPVDDKAVIRLIRASKGQIQIPGVTYRETIKTSIRR